MNAIPKSVAPALRLLLGPGPSPVDPRVLDALSRPTLGHLDPAFLAIMDEVRDMQRALFNTSNELTFPMSGTGSAGMETCLVNTIEPGDRVLVAVNGVFGTRLAEVARRARAEVTTVDFEWGQPVTPDAVRSAAGDGQFKALCVVHAETSTGVLSDVAALRPVADDLGALLIVDCVTSLGGLPVRLDDWGVDAAYSGTQKCLSCPPGLSPVSLSPRAQAALAARKSPVQSWSLDLSLIGSYWGAERAYHHTAPINMIYGLHEALRLAHEEGLEQRFARHAAAAAELYSRLEALGLELLVAPESRLAPLTSVRVPAGIDEAAVRSSLLADHDIEIGGGLGPLKGAIWRIGLMGHGATRENAVLVAGALEQALAAQRG